MKSHSLDLDLELVPTLQHNTKKRTALQVKRESNFRYHQAFISLFETPWEYACYFLFVAHRRYCDAQPKAYTREHTMWLDSKRYNPIGHLHSAHIQLTASPLIEAPEFDPSIGTPVSHRCTRQQGPRSYHVWDTWLFPATPWETGLQFPKT